MEFTVSDGWAPLESHLVNLFQVDGVVDAFLHGIIGAYLFDVTAVAAERGCLQLRFYSKDGPWNPDG